MQYDLEERTLKFSKDVLQFIKEIKQDTINISIIQQLVRSCTSVGANYREANAASSKKDFKNKVAISRKEIQETKYWLEIMASIHAEKKEILRPLWAEAHELSLIFNKIFHSLKSKH
jgi:four helix bundle protein